MQLLSIPIDHIIPNPEQPRTSFDQTKLQELADSILANGLINPITVERAGDIYILEDGERRWRACQIAGLETIQAVVKPPRDSNKATDRLTKALVANLQREDMNPIDEAKAYQRLMEIHGAQNKVARQVGVSALRVSNRLYLLDLDPPIQELIAAGRQSNGVSQGFALTGG